MRVVKKLNVWVVVLICVLSSCASLGTEKKTKRIATIMTGAPDAISVVLSYFQTSDIVFIGGASHRLLNEVLFVTENLQRFYDAGVRYILIEGGSKNANPISSDEELQQIGIILFYPWEYVGVRYTSRDWGKEREYGYETYLINLDKKGPDTLKMVGLETGRMDFIPGSTDPWELLNYRDEYMANMAFGFIDNAAPGEKFLVLAGGEHGIMDRLGPNSDPEIWKPLGAHLKERYRKRFTSLFYITLDESIKMDPSYQGMLQSEAWRSMPLTPKFIIPSRREEFVSISPFFYNGPFDGYIVDKTGIKGIMYSYALFKPDVLKEIIEQTKQYEAHISVLSNENRFDYEDTDTYYNIMDLLINVYYLRLFFGAYFPYDFWDPQMPLKEALSVLELAAFADGADPKDLLSFPIPSVNTMRDYHDHIELFASLDGLEESGAEERFAFAEPYLKKAHELFPFELWTDYWYAKMYTILKDHEKAYEHLQIILNDPLIASMQIYPEVLELAAFTSEGLGNREQATEYRALRNGISNEFGIDAGYFSLFLAG
jgi:tetratricopeptide (TPR) repeat protein